ncbi:MAG: hypothetical protein PHW10_05590 [Candidatus Peribacteraceae bacterium]|nr:hypothetical protein [Candidatus Peribacteraceae bacterium]
MTQAILWLTATEQAAFRALPPAVQDGWQVQPETRTYEDTPEKRNIRLSMVRLHDPKLLALRDKVQEAASGDAAAALLDGMDLEGVADDDLAELFFALGPTLLTRLIEPMVLEAKSDDDLEGVAALVTIRHSMLSAFTQP